MPKPLAPQAEPDELDLVRCVSLTRAAELLGVSYTTVWRLVDSGALRTVLINSKRRIRVPDLAAYLDRQQRRGSVAPIRLPTRRTTADSEPPVRQPGRGMAAPDPSARKEGIGAPGVK